MTDLQREQEIEAMEKAAKHLHRFEQQYERSVPSCTVKVWECPCGVWSIQHFGCFNANHLDQDSLATSKALLAELKEAQEKLKAVGEFGNTLAKGHVSGTLQGRVKAGLDYILKGGD